MHMCIFTVPCACELINYSMTVPQQTYTQECQVTLKPHVVVGLAVAPDPQSVHESSISVLDAEVVRLQRAKRVKLLPISQCDTFRLPRTNASDGTATLRAFYMHRKRRRTCKGGPNRTPCLLREATFRYICSYR